MSGQVEIDYGPAERARRAWPRALEVVRRFVFRVTPKEAAFLFDTSASHLSDALAERDGRAPRMEWLFIILPLTNETERDELLDAINGILGREYKPKKPASPEQRIAAAKQRLRDEIDRITRELDL